MTDEDALWHIRNVYANLIQTDSRAAEPYRIAIEALERQIAEKKEEATAKCGDWSKAEERYNPCLTCSQINNTFCNCSKR